MSTPRSLHLPASVRRVTVETSRGSFAALRATPAAGVCDRQPAVCVPGYTGSKEDFIPILQTLAAAGRTVVAIDQRGQYESPAAGTEDGYRLPALAADVAAVGETVAGGSAFHLLGHSFGGLVAQELAATGGARIESLTIMSSGPGMLTGGRAEVLRWILPQLRAAGPDQLPQLIEDVWKAEVETTAQAEGVPPDILAFLRTRMLSNCPTGLQVMAEQLLQAPDLTKTLAAMNTPMLVIYGENDDTWAPAIQEKMAGRLSAQRVCIPRVGHSPAVEAPETTASVLTAFWNGAENGLGRSHPGASPSQGRRAGAAAAPSGQ